AVPAVAADAAAAQRAVDRAAAAGPRRPVAGTGPAGTARAGVGHGHGQGAPCGQLLAAPGRRGHDARMTPAADTPDDKPQLPACVVNAAAYNASGKLRDISLDEISEVLARDDDSFVWVGVYEPEDAVLDKLQEEFDLHDLAIEDARNAHQRPKLEAYGDCLFVVVNTAQVVDERIRYGETHAFLGPRYLVTVRHGASLSYAPVRARVEREPELLELGPSYALYAVLDAIVDNYLPI